MNIKIFLSAKQLGDLFRDGQVIIPNNFSYKNEDIEIILGE